MAAEASSATFLGRPRRTSAISWLHRLGTDAVAVVLFGAGKRRKIREVSEACKLDDCTLARFYTLSDTALELIRRRHRRGSTQLGFAVQLGCLGMLFDHYATLADIDAALTNQAGSVGTRVHLRHPRDETGSLAQLVSTAEPQSGQSGG